MKKVVIKRDSTFIYFVNGIEGNGFKKGEEIVAYYYDCGWHSKGYCIPKNTLRAMIDEGELIGQCGIDDNEIVMQVINKGKLDAVDYAHMKYSGWSRVHTMNGRYHMDYWHDMLRHEMNQRIETV